MYTSIILYTAVNVLYRLLYTECEKVLRVCTAAVQPLFSVFPLVFLGRPDQMAFFPFVFFSVLARKLGCDHTGLLLRYSCDRLLLLG